MRIDHTGRVQRSEKSLANEWLFTDIQSIVNLMSGAVPHVVNCCCGGTRTLIITSLLRHVRRLWSRRIDQAAAKVGPYSAAGELEGYRVAVQRPIGIR